MKYSNKQNAQMKAETIANDNQRFVKSAVGKVTCFLSEWVRKSTFVV